MTDPGHQLCADCYEFVRKLTEFEERCVETENLFSILLSSDENSLNDVNYLKALRHRFGLDSNEVDSNSTLANTIIHLHLF